MCEMYGEPGAKYKIIVRDSSLDRQLKSIENKFNDYLYHKDAQERKGSSMNFFFFFYHTTPLWKYLK